MSVLVDLDNSSSDLDSAEDAEKSLSESQGNWDAEHELIAKSNTLDGEDVAKPEHLQVLQRCFGHKTFRPLQWKIISSIINDRRDNCAIMATGYGKSLCFQYPSVYAGGVTVVVSPLISLMEDQVLSLSMSNIPACLLGSAQKNQTRVLEDIYDSKYNMVYVTPEFISTDLGHSLLQRINDAMALVLIAIDEAHCVSSWGHDFRHQYRTLGQLREIVPNVPILAVTATATPRVRKDIAASLKLRNPQFLCSGFDRPNLYFVVNLKGTNGPFADLKTCMKQKDNRWTFSGSTIIYCITRKQTEEIAALLNRQGCNCAAYHAGMSIDARKKIHENFLKDKLKTIVATIAFGMGIDKPDVRNVIHYGTSRDIESYYQEVGRAGRDGQQSNCILFYSMNDFDVLRSIQELTKTTEKNRQRRQRLEKIMISYVESRGCRREFILNYFEGGSTKSKSTLQCCDNCFRKQTQAPDHERYEGLDSKGLYDFTSDINKFLSSVDVLRGKFGLSVYVYFLRGANRKKVTDTMKKSPMFGCGKDKSEEWWKAIGRIAQKENFLKQTSMGGRFPAYTLSLTAKGELFMKNSSRNPQDHKLLLHPTPEVLGLLKPKKRVKELIVQPSTSKQTDEVTSITKVAKKGAKDRKPQMRLLPVRSDSDMKENEPDSMANEEKMKIYKLLMKKRSDLANVVDCMPYSVASDEALMKMAQLKPVTIAELRDCQLHGFTEAKIKRFGDEFIKTIRSICNLAETSQNTKKSIQDILAQCPISGAKITATAEASYSMYKSGLSVQEIATKRGVIPSTVVQHLSNAILVGYPIELIDLNVTIELRDQIIKVIRSPEINSDYSVSLVQVKQRLPEEISYDVIKVVQSYLRVRDHLATLGVSYEDFEIPLETTQNLKVEETKKRGSQENESVLHENVLKRPKLEETVTKPPKLTAPDMDSFFDDDFELGDVINIDSSENSSESTKPATRTDKMFKELEKPEKTLKSFSKSYEDGPKTVSTPVLSSSNSCGSDSSQNSGSSSGSTPTGKKPFTFKSKSSVPADLTDFMDESAKNQPRQSSRNSTLPPWFRKI